MLFRPSFCAHCGERIERSEWRLWTSRRFCPVCESEFKGQDLIPRFVVGLGILFGVFGFGAYFRSGPEVELRALRQTPRPVERRADAASQVNKSNAERASIGDVDSAAERSAELPVNIPKAEPAVRHVPPELPKPRAEAAPVYYCGAETKKGTPCSRRVKGNVRCYQHVGMPAMVTDDKLKFKQQ